MQIIKKNNIPEKKGIISSKNLNLLSMLFITSIHVLMANSMAIERAFYERKCLVN